jgi:hypothetical protein
VGVDHALVGFQPWAKRVVTLAVIMALSLAWINIGEAAAGTSGPGWAIRSRALPTNFASAENSSCEEEEHCDTYLVTATNDGSEATPEGSTVVIRDKLPAGVVVKGISVAEHREVGIGFGEPLQCSEEAGASSVQCTFNHSVPPGSVLELGVEVLVGTHASPSITNVAEIEGGGAPTQVSFEPSTVANTANGQPPSFGVESFSVHVSGPNGVGDAQAGDHPEAVTTTIDYTTEPTTTFSHFLPIQEQKTSIIDLPLGFVGNPLVAALCPESAVFGSNEGTRHCPGDSQIGIVGIEEEGHLGLEKIFNVVPEPGYPALFAFELAGTVVFLRPRVVPTASGYALSVAVPDVPRAEAAKVTGVTVTFFGDPAERDGGSLLPGAFMTNPVDCAAGPQGTLLEMNSWVDPSVWVTKEAAMYEASSTHAVGGCSLLQFNPSIEVTPEEAQVDTPSGLEVDLKIPQGPNVAPDLATPELKNAVVKLPEGVSVTPGAADGLLACPELGPEGINITRGWTPTGKQPLDPADPEAMEIGPDGLPHVARGHCPSASQIGTVEVTTPVLASPLKGHVYVAQPLCGGAGQPACSEADAADGNLFRLYLEVAGSGVIVKLEGRVSANPTTGQLTTTFAENPQLPFSELKLILDGGAMAPLSTPQSCGTFTTTSDLTPWSAPITPDATPSSSFPIVGCGGLAPFAPTFSAGTVTAGAATSSPFTLTLTRRDGEQDFSAISVATPPGIVGMLSQVPLCGEPQAATGSCPEASRIGTTTVAAGAGSHPFWISGKVYLTGPYNGAPFGLTVVVPAKAGPFNLGNVVVRSAINVDPVTSAITVTSGPLPQITDGVPFRLKTVNVTIDRPGFMLNPTDCEAQAIKGTIAAAQGARASVSSPFSASGCASLPFKPSFTVTTQAKTSKVNGASLDVKVAYPSNGEANIKAVKVDLPLQLPSRLTTLQKACAAAVFESNPAECAPESIVGIAKAHTPVLPVTLEGPAYLVSHGNEAFPNLVVVIQGEGVRVDLTGQTQIRKGITSSNFASVPDVPVSSFELYLPEGHYSALTANGNLCKVKLAMPTKITGQNGAVIKQTTQIKVTGCPKAKKATKARRAKRARRGRSATHARAVKGRET